MSYFFAVLCMCIRRLTNWLFYTALGWNLYRISRDTPRILWNMDSFCNLLQNICRNQIHEDNSFFNPMKASLILMFTTSQFVATQSWFSLIFICFFYIKKIECRNSYKRLILTLYFLKEDNLTRKRRKKKPMRWYSAHMNKKIQQCSINSII